MADMKLIEKPQLPKPSRPEFSNHRHASLYSKEMAMRNKTHIQQNTSSQKTIAPVPRARPSQQQVSGHTTQTADQLQIVYGLSC